MIIRRYNLQGDIAEALKIEDILAAYGYKNIYIVDPQDLEAMEQAVQNALASEVPAAIITRRPCLLIKRIKHDIGQCMVDEEKCVGCKRCLNQNPTDTRGVCSFSSKRSGWG